MPVAKQINTSSGRGSRLRIRPSAATQVADTTELTLNRGSFETLRQHKGAFRKVLTTYAGAVEKAERLGRSFELVIRVDPDRKDPAVEERPADGDALDRALASARKRGAVRVAEIMASPDMLSAREFGRLIGASHETVNQKRKAGEILALEGAKRGLRYPRWQVTDDGRLLPGLREILAAVTGGPWSAYRFLLQPHNELDGKTGLDALKRGKTRQTLDVVESISRGAFA